MTKPKIRDGWEERFDERFPGNQLRQIEQIKSFIRTETTEAEKNEKGHNSN